MADISSVAAIASSVAQRDFGQDLIDKVRRKIQDDSYSSEDILEFCNQGMVEVAGEFYLPDLEAWESVYTDIHSPYVPMPADYLKNLKYCQSGTNNRPIKIYGSKDQLYQHFYLHDRTSRVVGVAVQGRQLYYQHIPATPEELVLNYYRYPDPLLVRSQKPTCLPPHLTEPLLVSYACKEIFAEIEDGIEGRQVNTERWTIRWDTYRAKLHQFLGPENRIPIALEDDIAWDYMANI